MDRYNVLLVGGDNSFQTVPVKCNKLQALVGLTSMFSQCHLIHFEKKHCFWMLSKKTFTNETGSWFFQMNTFSIVTL